MAVFHRFWQYAAMHSTLALFSLAATLLLVVGIVLVMVGLKHAPEGFEDENGFQFGHATTDRATTQLSLVKHDEVITRDCLVAVEKPLATHAGSHGLASAA